jgi:hypothetical protein
MDARISRISIFVLSSTVLVGAARTIWRTGSWEIMPAIAIYLLNLGVLYQRYQGSPSPQKQSLSLIWAGLSVCILMLLAVMRPI